MDKCTGRTLASATVRPVDARVLDLLSALVAAAALAVVTPALIRADLREHRLPNRLVGIAAAGLGAALLAESLLTGRIPTAALLAAVGAGLFYLVLSIAGGMGMGDVKLSAVLAGGAALVSVSTAIASFLLAFLLGGVWALGWIVLRSIRRMTRTPAQGEDDGIGKHTRGSNIPFGPAMLLGHWLCVLLWIVAGVLG